MLYKHQSKDFFERISFSRTAVELKPMYHASFDENEHRVFVHAMTMYPRNEATCFFLQMYVFPR